MMLKALHKFIPYSDLMPIKHDLLLKSGTLKGVYCYGGYLPDNGRAVPFTIMLNQKKNNRDRILQILELHFGKILSGQTASR